MPIFHARITSGSRADGQSAAVKIAYILREGAYGGRDDLVAWGSGNMPPWASANPRLLFEAADLHERVNGRLFVHVWVALPNELSESERHELGLAIAEELTAAGLPFVYAIHSGDPKSPGDPANPHIHIVISERLNDAIPRDSRQWFRRANRRHPSRGGAAKDRSLKAVTWVQDVRKVIERLTNEHLALAGCPARVTADSHAARITEAEAWDDTETAELLRQHPPGVHLGPAAAAIERDRFRGKRGETPELARPGEPTERGDLARAKSAEEERIRGEPELVAGRLRRAREEERLATASVSAARSAGLSDGEIVAVYEQEEAAAAGSGWAAVEAAAAVRTGRKNEAEAAASRLGIDVECVVRVAHERAEDPVLALEEAVGVFEKARAVLLLDEEIRRLWGEAESAERASGVAAVAETTLTRAAWKKRAEASARAAGIDDVEAVYAGGRSRNEDPLAALESATAERRRQARIVLEARSALLTDEAIEAIRVAAESAEPGSGWSAVEVAAAERLEQKKQTENAAAATGIIDIDGVYASARERREDPLSVLERVTEVVVSARAVLLTDEAIEAIRAEAESQEGGSGWSAVGEAARTRSVWKARVETAAREAGIDDVAAVYSASRSRNEDPLSALEAATQERRNAACRERLYALPAGQELYIAYLTAVLDADGAGQPTSAQVEQVLAAAESDTERLERARGVFEDPWSRMHYTASAGELGDRFTLAAVDAALTAAEDFAGRVAGLSEGAGLAELTAAVEAGGERTAAELDAALARAEEAERQAQEEARRHTAVEGREGAIRATTSGPGWLLEAEKAVLRGADRQLTLDERESIATTVERQIREDFAGRREGLAATAAGAELLEQALAEGSATTLAAEERVIEFAERRLAALRRREAEAARKREEEARKRRELTDRTAAVRATTSGAERLEIERRARFGMTDRELTLDEALSIVETVVLRIKEDLDQRSAAAEASAGGGELLERVVKRRGGPPGGLAEREDVLQVVEQRLQAADAVEKRLPSTAPNSQRPGYRVPAVPDAVLDAVVAEDDDVFVTDIVFVLRARYEQRAQRDVGAGGYDAKARDESARRHFGSALASGLRWCVLKIREIILAACNTILGGRGETGQRVEASLESAKEERQTESEWRDLQRRESAVRWVPGAEDRMRAEELSCGPRLHGADDATAPVKPPAPFRCPTSTQLVEAVLAGDEAVESVRALFRSADPAASTPRLLMQAIDLKLLRAVLGRELAPAWVTPLESYYESARRASPATVIDFERAWDVERRRWQPAAPATQPAPAVPAKRQAAAPAAAPAAPTKQPAAPAPAKRRRPAPFQCPTSTQLVEAVLAGDEAVESVRTLFRSADPAASTPLLLRQVIDPKLLRAVLGRELAPAWVTPLESYYESARRASPATVIDFERAWDVERRRWQPAAPATQPAPAVPAKRQAAAPAAAPAAPTKQPAAPAPAKRRRPAPFQCPTSTQLVEAVLAGDEAVESVRTLFRSADPAASTPLLLRQVIDPKLLRAVLGRELAPAWVTPLESYYESARRASPATVIDFERAWDVERCRWQPAAAAEQPAAAAPAKRQPAPAEQPTTSALAEQPAAAAAAPAEIRADGPARPTRPPQDKQRQPRHRQVPLEEIAAAVIPELPREGGVIRVTNQMLVEMGRATSGTSPAEKMASLLEGALPLEIPDSAAAREAAAERWLRRESKRGVDRRHLMTRAIEALVEMVLTVIERRFGLSRERPEPQQQPSQEPVRPPEIRRRQLGRTPQSGRGTTRGRG